jgi:hypothetical protein
MVCPTCGNVNENENNFCKHCGHDLKKPVDPNDTIFGYSQIAQTNSNIDLGYLIIAILVLFNIFIWMGWNFFFRSSFNDDGQLLYKVVRSITTIFSIGQFVVMFIFAKKQTFKIVIGIIGAFVILYDLYYLFLSFSSRF